MPPSKPGLTDQADQPKYKVIRDELLAGIRRGEYGPGSRLPTERELSEAYAVHRMTVRQATAALVQSGLVVKRRPLGNFVREHLPDNPAERHINLICFGGDSAHMALFVDHCLATARQRRFEPRVLRVYPGGEHVAAEALAGPDPSILMGNPLSRRDELGRAVRDAAGRVVIIGARLDHAGVHSVIGDDELGLRLAVEDLHDRGHERIGLIASVAETDHPLLELQVQLWKQAMIASGLDRATTDKHVIRLEPVPVGGVATAAYDAVKRYHGRQRVRATALIGLNEEATVGANAALYELGVKVPGDVSLLVYAGTAHAALCVPPLTAVDVDVPGHIDAAFNLIERMADADPGADPGDADLLTVIRPTLIERQSVAARR